MIVLCLLIHYIGDVAEEVILVEVKDLVDDKIDFDVVADGKVDDTVVTVEDDIKVDNEDDVSEEAILVEVDDMVDDRMDVEDDDNLNVVVDDVNMVEEVILVEVEDMFGDKIDDVVNDGEVDDSLDTV